MAYCPHCQRHYREPSGEQGDHPCPHCGRHWADDVEDEEEADALSLSQAFGDTEDAPERTRYSRDEDWFYLHENDAEGRDS